jgi:hypothetical protein
MTTKLHPLGVQSDGIHTTLAARVANAAARLALTKFPFAGSVAFTDAVDVGKEARDEDTGRIFTLSGVGPTTWVERLIGTAVCFAANLSSAVADGFMAAVDYIRIYGVASADVSVPTGAGYVTLQTTAVLLSANDTARDVGVKIRHNQALASLMVRTGSFSVMVARLNDGTQTIQSLASGLPETGATPVLTGTLQTGVGWQATLNADGTVTIALAQDAVIARSAKCRYWVTETDTQVAP